MNMTREDTLLNEILDGGQIESQWSQWAELSQQDPALWRRLAEAQRDQLAMERTLAQAAFIADASEAPHAPAGECDDADPNPVINALPMRGSQRDRSVRLRAWSGWAVAAAVMIVAAVVQVGVPYGADSPMTSTQPAAIERDASQAAEMTAEQAFNRYLALGREAGTVVGEVPTRVLLDAQPSESGIGYDVTYLRQVEERATVPDLYEVVGQDDHGGAQLASYEPRRGGGSM